MIFIYYRIVQNCLEAVVDGGESTIAELPGGPGSPSLLAEDLLGATDGVGDVIGQESIAAQSALVVGEATVGRLAPVVVVDLEDTVVVGAVVVLRSDNAGAVGALVLGNASPASQLVTRNAQVGHLAGQGATVHGATQSGSGESQSQENDEELHVYNLQKTDIE